MSSDPAADRKAAASARQAKLLAKSQERLAKITGAAKGEGRVISDGITPPRAVAPTSLGPLDDDPDEVDLALHAPPASRRTPSSSQAQQAQFEAMGLSGMSSMFGGMGGAGGGEGGDMFAQMLASMGGGGAERMGAPGTSPLPAAPASPFPPTPRTLLDKLFPVLHLLAMVGLAVYAVGWLEPTRKFGMYGWMGVGGTVDWKAWSALSGKAPREGVRGVVGQLAGTALADVPLFWLFITVELVLQTTRLFLLRNRPPTPSLISSVLPILSQFSPRAALVLQTLIRYISLVSICLNDLAVLVFCLGAAVIVGKFKAGSQGLFVEKVVEAGGVGWNAARGEL